jgi:small subunit ribosomal protein S16
VSVRIRLRRMGAKKKPFYRVVVADSRSPRDGRFLDTIGTYDPRLDPAKIDIDREKALQWLEEGASPTDSARSLLSQAGIWQEHRTGVRPEPKPEKPAKPKPAPKVESADAAPVAVEVEAEAEAPTAVETAEETTAPEEAAEPAEIAGAEPSGTVEGGSEATVEAPEPESEAEEPREA